MFAVSCHPGLPVPVSSLTQFNPLLLVLLYRFTFSWIFNKFIQILGVNKLWKLYFKTYIVILVILAVSGSGHCKKAKKPSDTQLLKTIRRLAKEAGHPDPNNIGKNRDRDKDTCYTRACLYSAIQLLEAIDFTADPCDESGFAKYSCQRRLHRDPQSSYKSKYGNQSFITWTEGGQSEEFTREILEAPIRNYREETSKGLTNARIYYKQCQNIFDNMRHGTKSLWELSQHYGGWPILTEKEPTDFKWEILAAFLAQLFPKTLLFDVSPIVTETGIELSLDKGEIGSVKGIKVFLVDPLDIKKKLQGVLHQIKGHWNDTGATFDLPKSFDAGVDNTVKVTQKLLMNTVLYNSRAKTRMTISQLNAFTNHRIAWLEFFQIAYKATSLDIDEDTFVHVNKRYVQLLTKLWHSAGIWEASLLQYELFYKLMGFTSLSLSTNATLYPKSLDEKMPNYGGTHREWIKEMCDELTKEYFGAAMSKEYLRRHPYTPEVRKDIERITSNVLNGLMEYINATSVLSRNGKARLARKYSSVHKILGYPEWLGHKENFTRYYANLEEFKQNDKEYFNNMVKLAGWKEGVAREGFEPADDNLHYWELNKFIVDLGTASYLAISNAIRIPAPTTTPPLYTLGAPGYINYGSLGFILGHELSHGMDPEGIYYDRNGNYRKNRFLGIGRYGEWIASIKKDYNQSEIHYHGDRENLTDVLVHPSNRTINDDVGDIIGVQVAFNAYKKYLDGNRDLKLPGLENIPDEQLFYVTYSNMLCSELGEREPKFLWASTKSPGYSRATIPLKRSKQFAKTFQCEHKGEFEI